MYIQTNTNKVTDKNTDNFMRRYRQKQTWTRIQTPTLTYRHSDETTHTTPTHITLNEKAGHALKSTSSQFSKPCEVHRCRVLTAKAYTYAHTNVHMYTHTHTQPQTYTCTRIHKCNDQHIHVYAYTYATTNIYTWYSTHDKGTDTPIQ